MVFLYHVVAMSQLVGGTGYAVALLRIFTEALSSGVNIFFMISGYLISGSLARHGNVKIFLIDRAIRVYPVFLAIQLPLYILAPNLHWYDWAANQSSLDRVLLFFSNLFFLPGIFSLPLLQLNAWSLSYEAAFYMIAALFSRQLNSTRNWMILSGMIISAVLVIFMYPAAIFFVVGVGAYWLKHLRPAYSLPSPHPLIELLALFVYMFIMGALLNSQHLILGPQLNWHIHHLAGFAALFSSIYFWAILQGKSLFNALLQCRCVQLMGSISYSFYLIHMPVVFSLRSMGFNAALASTGMSVIWQWFCFGVMAFIVTVCIAVLSYSLLEQKLARWLKSQAHSRTVKP